MGNLIEEKALEEKPMEHISYINSYAKHPGKAAMVTQAWDQNTLTLTFKFEPYFWDQEHQNLLLTTFEETPVTCHEAMIRRMVRELQAVCNTGKPMEAL
jgi:hypothetical protein